MFSNYFKGYCFISFFVFTSSWSVTSRTACELFSTGSGFCLQHQKPFSHERITHPLPHFYSRGDSKIATTMVITSPRTKQMPAPTFAEDVLSPSPLVLDESHSVQREIDREALLRDGLATFSVPVADVDDAAGTYRRLRRAHAGFRRCRPSSERRWRCS